MPAEVTLIRSLAEGLPVRIVKSNDELIRPSLVPVSNPKEALSEASLNWTLDVPKTPLSEDPTWRDVVPLFQVRKELPPKEPELLN